jgi:hypothetical protein
LTCFGNLRSNIDTIGRLEGHRQLSGSLRIIYIFFFLFYIFNDWLGEFD